MIGTLVIIYVTSGGTKAVSLTQRQQMTLIMSGMILSGILAFTLLPERVSFSDSINMAGHLGKLNLVNLEFNPNDRYNIWSGLIAGTFLFLSYFGTDQSQVARYLGGQSVTESRLGLLLNGLLKIPMQFIILFIGVMVFVFYLFNQPPVFHNTELQERAMATAKADSIKLLEGQYTSIFESKKKAVESLLTAIQLKDETGIAEARASVKQWEEKEKTVRGSVKGVIQRAMPQAKTQDRDYIFLNFVLHYLPHGIIGLLLAVMFSAAMSSMAGELNALASTTCVDIYKRAIHTKGNEGHYVRASKWFTVGWALLAMLFAMLATFAENLIQFVNIVGSLFYGTILGIFLTAFYLKFVRGTAVFWAAIIAEMVVLYCFFYTSVAFLLYNIIGCLCVIILAIIFQVTFKSSLKR
jgi:Na+/proline symporter